MNTRQIIKAKRTRPRRQLSQVTIMKKDGLINLMLWRRDWRLTKLFAVAWFLVWLAAWWRHVL